MLLLKKMLSLYTHRIYAEYITIKHLRNLVKIPSSLRLQVASLLPSGALHSYAAVLRAKPYVEMKMKMSKGKLQLMLTVAVLMMMMIM